MLRFAYKHQLNVVLPSKNYLLQHDNGFDADTLNNTEWFQAGFQPQIFCLHNRWSYPEVEKLMHKKGTEKPFYLTILRDPVSLFISVWDYYDLPRRIGGKQRITLQKFAMSDDKPNYLSWAHLNFRDITLYDFGLPIRNNDDIEAVKAKILEIEQTFDLVMIVEQFDESIVLMKHMLCWNNEDVTSLKLNVHNPQSKSSVNEAGRQKLREWLKSDVILYEHFNRIFKAKVAAFGSEKMEAERMKMHELNNFLLTL